MRIQGLVEKVPASESDAYFEQRPVGSRIGAWASPQSAIIKDRSVLEEAILQFENKFNENKIPRPEYWGGYIVKPTLIEFWQGRSSRLHDRIQYNLQTDGTWKKMRIAP